MRKSDNTDFGENLFDERQPRAVGQEAALAQERLTVKSDEASSSAVFASNFSAENSDSKPLEKNKALQSTAFDTHIQNQSVSVTWNFPVAFTRDLFDPQNTVFQQTISGPTADKRHRILVFVDEGVIAANAELGSTIRAYCNHFDSQLELVCDPVIMPAGEVIKNDLHYVERMQLAVHEHRIDRHSYIIGVGGGALLDAVGLVAATSHRGIRHVRVPTTVLAQNDSGIGVKNGVNLFGQKNYIGTFAPPFAVLNDYAFIETLPPREKIAGMAEAVKVGLIRDGDFFQWLEQSADDLITFEPNAMRHMIRRCAELHMHQISKGGDPFETGSARPLDFGHWAAHKLEILTKHRLRHGEAVAIGMALDTRYSVTSGLLPAGDDERVCFLLEHLGFKLWHSALLLENSAGKLELLAGLEDFREHLGGELTITLLESLGKGVEVNQMDNQLVAEGLNWLRARHEESPV